MPLPYITDAALSIPAGAFNADGLAVLIAQGGRYGERLGCHLQRARRGRIAAGRLPDRRGRGP